MSTVPRTRRMTVEEAWLAKQREAGPGPEEAGAPPPPPRVTTRPVPPATPVGPYAGARPPARPRIEPDPAILGLSRHTRSRLGSRLFNLFFVCVFALILVQMVVALLTP
jgi:hypothetical protein